MRNTTILLDLGLPLSKNSKEIEVVALKSYAVSLSATLIRVILALSRLLNLLYVEIEQEPDKCHQNASRQWFY